MAGSRGGLSPGPGQTVIFQDSSPGSTFWVQSTTAPTAKAGTRVTINDSAPALNLWAMTLVEVG